MPWVWTTDETGLARTALRAAVLTIEHPQAAPSRRRGQAEAVQWGFPRPHSRNNLAPPLFRLRGPWGPHRWLRGSPWGHRSSSQVTSWNRRDSTKICCAAGIAGRFQHFAPQLGVPGAPLSVPAPLVGREPSSRRIGVPVRGSLCLHCAVRSFSGSLLPPSSHQTQNARKCLLPVTAIVGSQDGITLYSPSTGTFCGKLGPKSLPRSQLALFPLVGKGRTHFHRETLPAGHSPLCTDGRLVLFGAACLSLTHS